MGGVKSFITEFNQAMDKTAENEAPLTQEDKTRILTNTYCDDLHFSKKDAKDLVEHPEKLEQYCKKYGYRYE